MLGKLIKYETKASARLILLFWAALIAISIIAASVNRIAALFDADGIPAVGIANDISIIVYILLLSAMVAGTAIIIVLRFYRGLYGSEGYLMNTLPVKPWQLITAKGIVATAAVFAGIIVGLISVIIMAIGYGGWIGAAAVSSELFSAIGQTPVVIAIALEVIVIALLAIMGGVYRVYASLAIGQLVNRHRLLLAVGAYIGIGILLSIIGAVFAGVGFFTGDLDMFAYSDMAALQLVLLICFIAEAIQLAVFHIVTERITAKHLNLL